MASPNPFFNILVTKYIKDEKFQTHSIKSAVISNQTLYISSSVGDIYKCEDIDLTKCHVFEKRNSEAHLINFKNNLLILSNSQVDLWQNKTKHTYYIDSKFIRAFATNNNTLLISTDYNGNYKLVSVKLPVFKIEKLLYTFFWQKTRYEIISLLELSSGLLASTDIHIKIWDLYDYSFYAVSNTGTWVSWLLKLSNGMFASCSFCLCFIQQWDKSMKQPIFSKNLNQWEEGSDCFRSNFLMEIFDGYLIAGDSENGFMRRWNLTDNYKEYPVIKISNGKFIMTKLQNDSLVSGDLNGIISVIDPNQNFTILDSFKAHSSQITELIVLDNGYLVSAGENIKIWNPNENFKLIAELEHYSGIARMSKLRNGLIVSGGYDGSLIVWDTLPNTPTYRPLHHIKDHDKQITNIFQLSNDLVVTTEKWEKIQISDPKNEFKAIASIEDYSLVNNTGISSITQLSNGKIITGGSQDNGDLKLYDLNLESSKSNNSVRVIENIVGINGIWNIYSSENYLCKFQNENFEINTCLNFTNNVIYILR